LYSNCTVSNICSSQTSTFQFQTTVDALSSMRRPNRPVAVSRFGLLMSRWG